MAKNTEKNTDASQFNIPEGFEEENLGFAPYWKAAVGEGFTAKPIQLDARDPKFERWLLQNLGADLKCFKGPTKEAEEVTVKNGEHFTMSNYKGCDLTDYIGYDIFAKVVGTTPSKHPNDMFVWKLAMKTADRAALNAKRQEHAKAIAEMNRDAKNQLTA